MLRFYLLGFVISLLLAACSGDRNVEIENGSSKEPTIDHEDTTKLGDWDIQPSLVFTPPIGSVYKNEGDVVLRIHTSAEGTVDTVWIIESSMHTELDSLALEQARRMIFKPAVKEGKPVSAQFYYPFKFRLR